MAFKILGRNGVDLNSAGSTPDNLSAEARRIVNMVNPVDPQDAATKDYVDNATTAASSALDGTFRIKNTADQTKQAAFDVSGVAAGQTRTIIMPNANVNLGLVATAIQSTEKGAANGVATLDAGSKIPQSQLPAIAITDTFVVASQVAMLALTAETGDVAVRTDLNKSYILAGTDPTVLADWQELLTPTDAVQSVNGQTGTVVLTTTNIAEGTNLYYTTGRFDTAFGTKSTSDLSEGSNLYFTAARVLATALTGYAVGADADLAATDTVLQAFQKVQGQLDARAVEIFNAQTDATQALSNIANHIADATDAHDASAISNIPSGNLTATDQQAVNNELQSDIDSRALASDLTAHINDATDAHDASAISNVPSGNLAATDQQGVNNELQGDIDALDAVKGQMFEAGVAGEAFAADQVWLVRRAKNGETAGRYYKALADSSANSRIVGFIIVGASAVSAAGAIRVYKLGSAALGSSDSAFISADLNTPVFLHQSTAGKWTLTPSQSAGQWLKEVGYVGNLSIMEFQPGLLVQA